MGNKRIWVISKRLQLVLYYPKEIVEQYESDYIRLKAFFTKTKPKDYLSYRKLSRTKPKELDALMRGFKYYVLRIND